MPVTILAAILLMAAYFLVLYGGVGFIQDKRFFSSAPKENLDAIPDKKERFRGAHIIGWIIEGIAVLLFLAAAVLAAWAGIQSGFGFSASLAGILSCSIAWSSTIFSFSTGSCSAIQTSSRIFIPS